MLRKIKPRSGTGDDQPQGIGIFGGTFNPVHIAHLRAAEEIREILGLGKIIFVPAGNPPLKGSAGLAPAKARLKMVKLAIKGNPYFEVSDLECRRDPEACRKTAGPSYTVKTLEKFREKFGASRLFFITGADVFENLHLWWRPERLTELADFVVMSRPGFNFSGLMRSPFVDRKSLTVRLRSEIAALDAGPLKKGRVVKLKLKLASGRALYLVRVTDMEVSAREIRALLAAGKSARYLLPEAVLSFIIANGFYLKPSS